MSKITRRQFIKGMAATGASVYTSRLVGVKKAFSNGDKSRIFRVAECPVHDGELRHEGLDTLLDLLAANGVKLYQSNVGHPWEGPQGILDSNDVVLIKVNCQWKCRGTTNTDVLQGLIYRILEHPGGFTGEVVIFENGQGVGAFDGYPRKGGSYSAWPEIDNGVYVNAEEETSLTVDYLVNSVFKDYPVSSYLLDPIRSNLISDSDHSNDGYRLISDVSYPCFTSAGGHRIELREGIWNGLGYDTNLKLINVPVLKTHGGTGITGVLKHSYGILSMADSHIGIRHYSESGTQCGKMWSLVRSPDLNILDCIWVSHASLRGYPPETTYRANVLLAGIDPVALDYFASKHVLLPLSGSQEHDPDSFSGLIDHLAGARDFINNNGGIGGELCHMGDDNIEVVSMPPLDPLCECDLVPDSTVIPRGGTLGFQASVTNNSGLSGHVYFATKVKLPSGDMYPLSGFFDGPYQLWMPPHGSISGHLSHNTSGWPVGPNYIYRGLVGQLTGVVYDTCEFAFEVIDSLPDKPVINSINPVSGPCDTVVEITGDYFGDLHIPANRKVIVAPVGDVASQYQLSTPSWTNTLIEAQFPCLTLAPGDYYVAVFTEMGWSNLMQFTLY
jgi:uncharacterized protein (DUF362 family)